MLGCYHLIQDFYVIYFQSYLGSYANSLLALSMLSKVSFGPFVAVYLMLGKLAFTNSSLGLRMQVLLFAMRLREIQHTHICGNIVDAYY